MVMSEERTATVEDNKSTFLLTNVLPQKPDLNQGVWLRLETFCNDLCRKEDKELFIYAGGVFHTDSVIGNGVAVPDSTWKIVVVLDKGQTLNDININTTVYSVMMPNQQGVRNDSWEKYITNVDQIELSTGYNFLSNVPENIQSVIESRIATSVNPKESQIYLVYPNPFSDYIYIEKPKGTNTQSIACYDIIGKKIEFSTEIQIDKIVLTTTELESGIYFIQVLNGFYVNNFCLVKE
jgi:endonuclease G